MSEANQYAGIGSVVKLSTNIGQGCKHCSELLHNKELDECINHFIKAHHYRLLHVGTETIQGQQGEPIHTTVAVLGI